MHFSSAALSALCFISLTQAAPFANPENEDLARRATYDVVNADGDSSSSSVAREVDTIYEVSTVTAPGAEPVAVTVTVTATPSSAYSSTPVASSTPCLETPAPSSSFFRRGLRAAGQPALFARDFSSSSYVYPTAAASESLYARGWYSAASGTPSATTPAASPTALVARSFGDWSSSASASPSSSSLSVPAVPTHLVARGWYSSSATPSASMTGVVARGLYASPSGTSSGTPSSSSVTTSAAPLAVRGPYGWYSSVPSASSIATPSASPALVARGYRSWGSSSVSSPVSSTVTPSATPVVY